MPFVQRDSENKIVGRFANRQPGFAEEYLPDDHAELQPSTADTVERVWSRIKAKRDAVKNGGVKVGTKWYASDDTARIQYLGLLEKVRVARAAGASDATRLQALGEDVRWKCMDNSFIYITVKHAEDIFNAVVDLEAAAFAVAEQHRGALEASAEPASYDYGAGWPAVYEG